MQLETKATRFRQGVGKILGEVLNEFLELNPGLLKGVIFTGGIKFTSTIAYVAKLPRNQRSGVQGRQYKQGTNHNQLVKDYVKEMGEVTTFIDLDRINKDSLPSPEP